MLFWKVRTEPFAEAKTARKSIPIFITLLLAALLFYGFSKGFYFLYGKLFDFVQKQVALYKIDAELPLFDDLDLIIRSASAVILVLLPLYTSVFWRDAGFPPWGSGKRVSGGIS